MPDPVLKTDSGDNVIVGQTEAPADPGNCTVAHDSGSCPDPNCDKEPAPLPEEPKYTLEEAESIIRRRDNEASNKRKQDEQDRQNCANIISIVLEKFGYELGNTPVQATLVKVEKPA